MRGAVIDKRFVHEQLRTLFPQRTEFLQHALRLHGLARRIVGITQHPRVARPRVSVFGDCPSARPRPLRVFSEGGRLHEHAPLIQGQRQIDRLRPARRGQHARFLHAQRGGQPGARRAHLPVRIIARVHNRPAHRLQHPLGRSLRPQVGRIVQPVARPRFVPHVAAVSNILHKNNASPFCLWKSVQTGRPDGALPPFPVSRLPLCPGSRPSSRAAGLLTRKRRKIRPAARRLLEPSFNGSGTLFSSSQ